MLVEEEGTKKMFSARHCCHFSAATPVLGLACKGRRNGFEMAGCLCES